MEPEETAHVIRQIDHADLGFGPGDTDGPNRKRHQPFLMREDMLDGGPYRRARRVGLGQGRRHRLAARLAEVDLRELSLARQHLLVALGTIGGIGPNRAGGVLRIDEAGELTTVIGGGIGDAPLADQPVPPVGRDMVLIAEWIPLKTSSIRP